MMTPRRRHQNKNSKNKSIPTIPSASRRFRNFVSSEQLVGFTVVKDGVRYVGPTVEHAVLAMNLSPLSRTKYLTYQNSFFVVFLRRPS